MNDLERLEQGFARARESGNDEMAKEIGLRIREMRRSSARGGQQPAVTGEEAVAWGDRMGRAGVSAVAGMIPGGEKAANFYEDMTGRQVLLGREPQGMGEKAVDFATRYAPMAGGMYGLPALRTAMGTVKGMGTLGQQSTRSGVANRLGSPERGATGVRDMAARTGDEMLNAITRQPWTTGVAEAGGLLGAGAGGAMLEEDFGSMGRAAGEITGGLLGGILPLAPRAAMNAWQGLKSSYMPFTEMGAKEMAARELRPLLRGQTEESLARTLSDAPPGATPFEATRNPQMRALQDRIVEDADLMDMSPTAFQGHRLRDVLSRQNTEGQLDLTREGRTLYGEPRDQSQRQVSMVREVAAPGGADQIQDGPLTEMFRQADQTFSTAYDQFRNLPARTAVRLGETDVPIAEAFSTVTAPGQGFGPDEAKVVDDFLSNQIGRFSDRIDSGGLTTGDLIAMRSSVREKYRKELNGGNSDRMQMYNDAEDILTRAIEGSLPTEQLAALKATDSQYRRFKVLETASYRGGDDPLTTDNVTQAARDASSQRQWTQGRYNDDMRDLSRSWRSLEGVMDKPEALRQLTERLPQDARRPLQAEFVNRLMGMSGRSMGTPDGEVVPSGQQLLELIGTPSNPGPYRESMRAVAGNQSEFVGMEHRVRKIADGLNILQAPSDGGRPRMFNSGPAFLFELSAALAGAGTASRLGSALDLGFGTLVIAERLGKKFTADTQRFLMQRPRQLMTDMVTDKKLFDAVSSIAMQDTQPGRFDDAARTINAWAAALVAEEGGNLEMPAQNQANPASVGTGWGM